MFSFTKSDAHHRESRLRRLSFESLENRLLLAAEIDVGYGNQAVPIGDHIDFGTVIEGASGRTLTFSVRNRGDQDLTLGAISLPDGFRVKEGLSSTIRPHRRDTFKIELMTDVPGVKSGVLRFDTNDPNEDPYEFVIAGEVTEANLGAPNVRVQCISCGNEPVRLGSTVDFGTSPKYGGGTLRTFRVVNDGDQDLHLGALQVPEGFRLIGRLSQTIRPGRSDDFMLLMKTNAEGMKSGTVRFTSDAPNAGTFEFAVVGEVAQRRQSEVDVLLSGDPIRSASVVDFGEARQGDSPRERTFTVVNRGTRTLTLGAPEVPNGFVLTEGLSPKLRPGARDTFTIQMTTQALGLQSGTLRLTSNDPNEGLYEFTIQGNVLEAGLTATNQPAIRVYCQSNGQTVPNGGTVSFSSTAPTKTFFVYNDGKSDLTLGDFQLPSGSGYSKSGQTAAPIAPGKSASFTITMNPSVAGSTPILLQILNNDPLKNPFKINLKKA
jgi:hypothetical protein